MVLKQTNELQETKYMTDKGPKKQSGLTVCIVYGNMAALAVVTRVYHLCSFGSK